MKINRKKQTIELEFEPKDEVKTIPKNAKLIAFIKKDEKHFRIISNVDGFIYETKKNYIFSHEANLLRKKNKSKRGVQVSSFLRTLRFNKEKWK